MDSTKLKRNCNCKHCPHFTQELVASTDVALPPRICTTCIRCLMHAVSFRQLMFSTINAIHQHPHIFRTPLSGGGAALDQPSTDGLSTASSNRNYASSDDDHDDDDNDDETDERFHLDVVDVGPPVACARVRAYILRATIQDFFGYHEQHFVADTPPPPPIGSHRQTSVPTAAAAAIDSLFCTICNVSFATDRLYDEHVPPCVLANLFDFAAGCRRLVQLQRRHSMAPHEFIRRMVFRVRRITAQLVLCQQRAWRPMPPPPPPPEPARPMGFAPIAGQPVTMMEAAEQTVAMGPTPIGRPPRPPSAWLAALSVGARAAGGPDDGMDSSPSASSVRCGGGSTDELVAHAAP